MATAQAKAETDTNDHENINYYNIVEQLAKSIKENNKEEMRSMWTTMVLAHQMGRKDALSGFMEAINKHTKKINQSEPKMDIKKIEGLYVKEKHLAQHKVNHGEKCKFPRINEKKVKENIKSVLKEASLDKNAADLIMYFQPLDAFLSTADIQESQKWEVAWKRKVNIKGMDKTTHSRSLLIISSRHAPQSFIPIMFDANNIGIGGRTGIVQYIYLFFFFLFLIF